MTEVKKISTTEGIYAFENPQEEIKKRLEEENPSLMNFEENNFSLPSLSDSDILAGLSEVENESISIDFDSIINQYSQYDSIIEENKNIINTKYSEYSYDDTQLKSLESTKSTIESDISTKQKDLESVFNGTHQEIKQAQNDVNTAQEAYSKALDESQNPQVTALKEQIEENTLNTAEQESIIAYFETQISDTQTQISQQESAISAIEGEITSYNSQISSLQALLSSTDNSKTKKSIESRITNLRALIGNAEAKKTNQQNILDTLNEKLEQLNSQKPQEEQKLEELKTARNNLEAQIEQINDETINNALKALQSARDTLESKKQTLSAQITGEIENSANELKNVENQIAKLKQELFEQEQEALNQLPEEQQSNTIQSSVYPTNSKGASLSPASKSSNNSQITQEQLEENLKTSKEDLNKKIDELLQALNWESQGAVFEARSTKDAEFDKFYSELSKQDPTLANEIKQAKETMDSKEQALDKAEAQLLPYDNQINELQGEIDNINIQISSLLEMQSELEEVDESELDSEQKTELKEKRKSIQEKIDELNEQKTELNKQINAIKQSDEYKELLNQKQLAQSEYNSAKQQYDSAMSKAQSSSSKEAYQKSYDEYHNQKQNALGEVQTAQTKVSELSKTLETSKADSLAKEYKFSTNNAQEILDFAKSFIGCNEADGSANKFLNGASSSATPWCAAFVQYVLQNSGEYDNTADWYKNISNKWYCPNIASAAQSAGAIVDESEAQSGDIVLFYDDSKGRYSHVGIITSIDSDGTVHTIEGNTSNQVAERTYTKGQRKMTFCRASA